MNIFLKKIRNRKIIVTLLISYILVLIVPYIVNRFNYVSIQNALIDEISNYNAEHLNGRANNLDNTIANVSEMVNTIFSDKEFRRMADMESSLTDEQRYNLSVDRSYIYGGFGFYVENVFVVYKNIDYYVGQNGTGNLNNFYRAYYSNRFSNYDEWYEFMTSRYYGELVVHQPPGGIGDGSVFYALSYMDSVDNEKLLANIVVEFRKGFLLSDSNEKNTFCLVDSDNRVIVCDAGEDFVYAVNDALSENTDENIINMVHNGQKKVLISQELTQCDWKYVSCISEEVFLEKVDETNRNYIYSMILCVLLGGVIIWYGVKKHYTPIKTITKTLSKNFAYDSDLDEYQYLTSVISKVVDEYKSDSQYQRIEKKLAKNSFLLSVLKGEELMLPDINDKLDYFGINFINKYFCVVSVNIDDCSNLFFEEEQADDNENLAKLIVENVFADLLTDKYEFSFCEDNGRIYVILALKSDKSIHELCEILVDLQNVIKSISNVKISIAVSNVYKQFRHISVCYREANELIQLCRIRNSNFLKHADVEDIALTEETYLYSAGIEQRLINYLMFGDYDDASTLLNEIINTNLNQPNTAFLKMKCLLFDIVATIFKVVHDNEKVADAVSLEKTDLLAKIDSCESVEAIEEELNSIFKKICDITSANYVKGEDRLSDGIAEFVQTNYNDHNLNVAFIAGQFGVSANYVSTIFKKETGMALSEYISSIRIEHAKDMLKTTNIKAGEIAEKVGFSSFRTFSRVFNSMVGTSPGEYRKKDLL